MRETLCFFPELLNHSFQNTAHIGLQETACIISSPVACKHRQPFNKQLVLKDPQDLAFSHITVTKLTLTLKMNLEKKSKKPQNLTKPTMCLKLRAGETHKQCTFCMNKGSYPFRKLPSDFWNWVLW